MNISPWTRLLMAISLGTAVPTLAAEQSEPGGKRQRPPTHDSTSEKRQAAPAPKPNTPPSPGAGEQVPDINSADEATLAAHPVIGPRGAKAIIAARPFATLDDLSRLQGISAAHIEHIRAAVVPPALAIESPAPDRVGPDHGRVDINTADLKTLESLPGVGPDLAPAIIAARPFKTMDELDRIQGISAERLEQVRAELTVATPELAMTKADKRGEKKAAPPPEPEPAPARRNTPDALR
jgi:competence ComEA-like helix-hairpin-helix protein